MMNTILPANCNQRGSASPGRELPPDDLRHQIGEAQLVRLVLDAVATLDFGPQDRPGTFRNPEGIGALPLLSLVTYAYATGRRASDEIEEAARRDRGLAYLAAGQLPSSPTIRRFRRAFNPAITQALWRVLQQAVAHRTTLSIEAKTGLTGALLQEARRRVDAAVLADTIALDY